jgi:hypothetical protein
MTVLRRVAALTITASALALVSGCKSTQTSESPGQVPTTSDVRLGAVCPVRGVWELVSVSENGKDQPLGGYRQRKIVTDRHFMWMGQAARRDTLPLRTQLDTLRAYQTPGGAGTYTTSGTTYIEHIDFFVIPSWVGTSFRATCRVEGDRWYHSFTTPNDTTAAPGPYQHIIEVWRRVE